MLANDRLQLLVLRLRALQSRPTYFEICRVSIWPTRALLSAWATPTVSRMPHPLSLQSAHKNLGGWGILWKAVLVTTCMRTLGCTPAWLTVSCLDSTSRGGFRGT